MQVKVEFDVQMIWAERHQFFPDPEQFIPAVAEVICEWIGILKDRLEDDSNAAWTDAFLGYVQKGVAGLVVRVEVS